MRITRIYQNFELNIDDVFQLTPEATNHILNVLRLKQQTPLTLFNGRGGEFSAIISQIEKRKVFARIDDFHNIERESSLQLHLAQSVSRGDKMDITIQKAIELGVQVITPIITEYCGIRLSDERWNKKLDHWRKIMIGACEQCGRNKIPQLNDVMEISDYFKQESAQTRLIFHHHATTSLSSLDKTLSSICLLIGPEGGFTDDEVTEAVKHQFIEINLGPRILRTETAGIAAIASLQAKYGDFL